jgi:hypothetical protein
MHATTVSENYKQVNTLSTDEYEVQLPKTVIANFV